MHTFAVLLKYVPPAYVLRGDVPSALLDPPHQGEFDVRPLVDGHRHGDQVEDQNGEPLDEKPLARTGQGTIAGVGKFVVDLVKCECAIEMNKKV